MFSGDSLAILTLLVGTMISAIFGAVPLDPGPKRNVLWGCAALFGLLAMGWLAAPVASPAVQLARTVIATVVQSGAFVMVGTISIAALMISRQPKATPTPSEPPAAPAPDQKEFDRVIRALKSAKDGATIVIQTATEKSQIRDAEREMPQMRASLLSAHKLFGLPMPPEDREAFMSLELHRRYRKSSPLSSAGAHR